MIVLPFSKPQQAGEMGQQHPHVVQQREIPSLVPWGITPCTSTCWRLTSWKAAWQDKTWWCCWTTNWPSASSAPLWQSKPTVFGAASPASQERCSFHSSQLWLRPHIECRVHFCVQARQAWTSLWQSKHGLPGISPAQAHKRWWRNKSTHHIKVDRELGPLTWRCEVSEGFYQCA